MVLKMPGFPDETRDLKVVLNTGLQLACHLVVTALFKHHFIHMQCNYISLNFIVQTLL